MLIVPGVQWSVLSESARFRVRDDAVLTLADVGVDVQWDVIDALAAQNMGGKSAESGITLSELLEFKITSPSQVCALYLSDASD